MSSSPEFRRGTGHNLPGSSKPSQKAASREVRCHRHHPRPNFARLYGIMDRQRDRDSSRFRVPAIGPASPSRMPHRRACASHVLPCARRPGKVHHEEVFHGSSGVYCPAG